MRVKTLAEAAFHIVAVMDGEVCSAEVFLLDGEASTEASRLGLQQMLTYVAEHGFEKAPSSWTHEADKKKKIYEFSRGSLRLFYFKGDGKQIAVCSGGVVKKGQKANKAAVAAAAAQREAYFEATKSKTLEVIEDEDQ